MINRKRSFFFLLLIYSIFAFSSGWSFTDSTYPLGKPGIESGTYLSYLQERLSEVQPEFDGDENKKNIWDLAVSSPSRFFESVGNLFAWKDNSSFLEYRLNKTDQPEGNLILNLMAGCDYIGDLENNNSFFLFNGMNINASVGNFFLKGRWWSGHFTRNNEFAESSSPLFDSWFKRNEDDTLTYLDNLEGFLGYSQPVYDLVLGRSRFQVGSSISGSVILNDDTNEYGFISTRIRLGDFTFSLLNGNLIPDSLTVNDNTEYAEKFLVSHKIDWQPSAELHFFAGEHVIYGNRSIDPSYLLPHTFLRITEHNLGNRDNVMIYAGFDIGFCQHQTLYLNLILDELAKSKFFSDWWGNKYALQIGHSVLVGKNHGTRLTAELTAIRPWLYTHREIVNKFSHDGIGLGHPDGSNLIEIAAEINTNFFDLCDLDLNYRYIRQGSIGNRFSINYETRPSDNASWLEGEISETNRALITLGFHPLAHHYIKIGVELSRTDDQDLYKKLYVSYMAIY